jgi:hypothetical protein
VTACWLAMEADNVLGKAIKLGHREPVAIRDLLPVAF